MTALWSGVTSYRPAQPGGQPDVEQPERAGRAAAPMRGSQCGARYASGGWRGRRGLTGPTTGALLALSFRSGEGTTQGDRSKAKITEASTKLRRLQDATKAGVNPAALVDAINEAQAELEAAEAERALRPETGTITRAEVYAMIDYLGNVGAARNEATPQSYRSSGTEDGAAGCGAVDQPLRERGG